MEALFDLENALHVAINSVNINDTMPLHTVDIIKREFETLNNVKIAVLGVSYLENVGDTRHSPSKTFVEALRKEFAIVKTHDPYVEAWPELEEAVVEDDITKVLPEADVVVFAVGHTQYLKLAPADVVKMCNTKPLIVDCSNFLSDETIAEYKALGCKVRGLGKGHIVD